MQIPGVLSCVVPLLLVQPPTATPPETPAMTSVKVIGVPGHAADVREVLVEEARLGRLEHVDAPWPHFRQWVAGRLVNTSTQPACNPAIDVKVLDARGRRLGDDEGRPVAVLRARDAASFSFSIPIADPSHSPPVRVEMRVTRNDTWSESSCGNVLVPESLGGAGPTPRPGTFGILARSTPVAGTATSLSDVASRLRRTPRVAKPDFSNVAISDDAFLGKTASLASLDVEVHLHNVQVASFLSYWQWVVGTIANDGRIPACQPVLRITLSDRAGNELGTAEETVPVRVPPSGSVRFEIYVPIQDPRVYGLPARVVARTVRVSPVSGSCGDGVRRAPRVLETPVPAHPEFFDVYGRSAPMTMPDGSAIPERKKRP